MASEVLPALLMALPAAQGGFTLSFSCYAERLRELGLPVYDGLPVVLALAATAFLAALGTVIEHSASIKEVVRVRSAPFPRLLPNCRLQKMIFGSHSR